MLAATKAESLRGSCELPRALTDLSGTVLERRYELGRVLGSGGMGAVFEARHLRLDRSVAIKVLWPSFAMDEEHVERFFREAKSASRIRHRNVVEILDYGEAAGGLLYSVMERLVGQDLRELLEAQLGGRLPWVQACELLVQIASGLKAAHAQGVIHRDIKPANCFLTDEDDEPLVKLVDFGVAKLVGEQGQPLTGVAQVLGTPSYIAPEMVRTQTPANPRTDIYALGVLAYRMLTGRVPFQAKTFFELVHRTCTEPVPSLRNEVPSIPPPVEAFILELLAKAPEDRPPDMLTVRERLVALSRETLGPHAVEFQGSSRLLLYSDGGPPPVELEDLILSWDEVERVTPASTTPPPAVVGTEVMDRFAGLGHTAEAGAPREVLTDPLSVPSLPASSPSRSGATMPASGGSMPTPSPPAVPPSRSGATMPASGGWRLPLMSPSGPRERLQKRSGPRLVLGAVGMLASLAALVGLAMLGDSKVSERTGVEVPASEVEPTEGAEPVPTAPSVTIPAATYEEGSRRGVEDKGTTARMVQ